MILKLMSEHRKIIQVNMNYVALILMFNELFLRDTFTAFVK